MSLQEAASSFNLWRDHPAQMVRDLFGIEPDVWQTEVLEAFPHCQRIAMKASKGVGKSCCEAWLAWNFLLTRPNPMIAATSVTGANLADGFWAETARWRERSPLLKDNFTWTKTKVFLNDAPATWYMSARPWSKTADKEEQGKTLAGIHSEYIMFILDESGGIPESVAASAEAALSSCTEGHILQAGNPTDLSGMLYRACTRDRKMWHVVEITSDPDSPKRSKRVSVEWARSQIEMYGRDNPWVLVNVFGQFPPASFNALIGVEEIEAAMKRSYRESEYSAHARILGCDVADQGVDKSVIFPRQGLQAFTPQIFRNIDGTQGANFVSRKWQEWDADACFVDDTGGFGSSWIDNLVRLGFSPIGVHFSEKSGNPRYYNKRSEMIFELVQWIKRGGALPYSPGMIGALSEMTYTHRNESLILEPKEMVKKRVGGSADGFDEVDALCFVKNTMIKTPTGDRDIQSLKVGELVSTPFGNTKIAKVWTTKTDKLTTAKFSNNLQLCGKGEHKIFVWGAGEKRMDALSLTDVVSVYGERRFSWVILKLLNIVGCNIQFRPLVAIILHGRGNVTELAFCTAWCGQIITGLYRRVVTFITRMGIGAIMKSKIFSAFLLENITNYTLCVAGEIQPLCKKQESVWHLHPKRQSNGTHPQLALNGIKNMQKNNGNWQKQKQSNAKTVAKIMKLIDGTLSIVRAPAPKKLALEDTSPMKGGANGATKSLLQTVTGKRNFALGCVLIKMGVIAEKLFCQKGIVCFAERNFSRPLSIRKSKIVPVSVQQENVSLTSVYNLTLEKHNVYYANDVLVYNCLTFAQPVMRASKFPQAATGRHRSDYAPLGMNYVKNYLAGRK